MSEQAAIVPSPAESPTLEAGSPLLGCIVLPAMAGVVQYTMRTALGDQWSASRSLQPGTPTCFDAGASSVEFVPADKNQAPVTLPAPFTFAVKFQSSGEFSGTLTVAQDT
jgi:hypothetical protein